MLMQDEAFMAQALHLAENARGRTSPNPMVGAVVVKDGRVVGAGWHRKAGTPHAEVHALNMAGDLARGSTVYVTLEPCSHYGRTGPCAKALVAAGVSRVVMAMKDPNPLVAGKGIKILKDAGIEVECGILESQVRRLNEVFLKFITTQRPFVVMKTAMSLDGKIATATGQSQWITNEASRQKGHEFRDIYDSILVGINTVLKDNPSLTTRLPNGEGHNPIRIVMDSHARLPLDSKLVTDGKAPTIIATTMQAPPENIRRLKEAGVKVLICGSNNQVNIDDLLKQLAEENIASVYVEGGGQVNYSMLAAGAVDRIYAIIAPKIIGGSQALTPVEGEGFAKLDEAVEFKDIEIDKLGDNIMVTGRVR